MPKVKTLDEAREANLQALQRLPEISVFMAAYYGITQLRALKALNGGYLFRSAQEYQLLQVFEDTVEATYRFGVLYPLMVEEGGVKRLGPFFCRWYNWWYDWLIFGHSQKQLRYLSLLSETNDPELVEWRPPRDWLDYRKEPPIDLYVPVAA